jgi:hypothetical protein
VLDRATLDFQRDHGLKQDGMIYTDGPTIKALAAQGRNGDTEIGHLTPGETVIPKDVLTLELQRELDRAFAKSGLDQGRYTVGGEDDSINPRTGIREFAGRRRRKRNSRGAANDDDDRSRRVTSEWIKVIHGAVNKIVGGSVGATLKYAPRTPPSMILKGINDARKGYFDKKLGKNR